MLDTYIRSLAIHAAGHCVACLHPTANHKPTTAPWPTRRTCDDNCSDCLQNEVNLLRAILTKLGATGD